MTTELRGAHSEHSIGRCEVGINTRWSSPRKLRGTHSRHCPTLARNTRRTRHAAVASRTLQGSFQCSASDCSTANYPAVCGQKAFCIGLHCSTALKPKTFPAPNCSSAVSSEKKDKWHPEFHDIFNEMSSLHSSGKKSAGVVKQ